MLMVVFGAGASYDSSTAVRPPRDVKIRDKLWRPPLADELFEPRKEFDAYLKNYPRCHGLVPLLRDRSDNRSVEQVLTEFQAQSEHNSARQAQLAAIKFYLQEMLWETEGAWLRHIPSGTNYDAILDEINNLFGAEPVCLVTFNYDTLLEAALQACKLDLGLTIESYVGLDRRFSVIRPHGSIRWARSISTPLAIQGGLSTHEGIIEGADGADLGEYRVVNKPQIHLPRDGDHYLLPALAIPLEKKRLFECPDDHLEFLRAVASQVDKLLIVGWRAADSHFIKLLKEGLKPLVKTLVVSGTRKEGEAVISRLKAVHKLPIQGKTFEGGFSQFIVSKGITQLLKEW